eukprot:scaffold4736_cov118-Isochrysis_galbana.AAC.8
MPPAAPAARRSAPPSIGRCLESKSAKRKRAKATMRVRVESSDSDDEEEEEVWEYELYGGAQLAPHRLYVLARLLTPPKGVWEGPRAMVRLPRNTRCRFLSPPPCAFLASSPRAWEVCLFLC